MSCNGSELRCAVGTYRSAATTRLASTQVLVKAAVTAFACDDHMHITKDQPPDMTTFRRRKDKSAEQLDLFGGGDKPDNAIYGDAA